MFSTQGFPDTGSLYTEGARQQVGRKEKWNSEMNITQNSILQGLSTDFIPWVPSLFRIPCSKAS